MLLGTGLEPDHQPLRVEGFWETLPTGVCLSPRVEALRTPTRTAEVSSRVPLFTQIPAVREGSPAATHADASAADAGTDASSTDAFPHALTHAALICVNPIQARLFLPCMMISNREVV